MSYVHSHNLKESLVHSRKGVSSTEKIEIMWGFPTDHSCAFAFCGDVFNFSVLLTECARETAICDVTFVDTGCEH
jgi:hypothetical protein